MKTNLFIAICACTMPLVTQGQVVMRTSTQFGFNDQPDIVMEVTGNITTNNTTTFQDAKLQLNLAGGDQTITGDLSVDVLHIKAGTTKTINGNLTISEGIIFTQGILKPAAGKILYTGDATNITGGSNEAYVEGDLFQTGGGNRFFPVGSGGVYAPLTFENVTTPDEIGVKVVNSDPGLIIDQVEIISYDPSRYWQLTTGDLAAINSRVTLSLNGLSVSGTGAVAILQSANVNGQAENLGNSSLDASSVTSRQVVTAPILAIGEITEVKVKVHDLITPFIQDDANDKLFIENIDKFDFNTVTLLDRWGVLVKEWKDFTNNVDYDFSRLSPGSYICIVEFGNTGEGSTTGKVSQMVTVLKTN